MVVRGTSGAAAPEHDLRLVDGEAVGGVRGEALGGADRVVDVLGPPAPPAHDVVVVVPGSPFEPGGVPRQLDPPDQAGLRARAQDVVERLDTESSRVRTPVPMASTVE